MVYNKLASKYQNIKISNLNMHLQYVGVHKVLNKLKIDSLHLNETVSLAFIN